MEMAGEVKCKWILDGRFLHEDVTGPAQPGMPPFHGLSVMGYDNATKKYQASWIDNMTTAILQMTGEMDAAGKALTLHFEELDPMTGKMAKAREVIHVSGRTIRKWSFIGPWPTARKWKIGEIICTRKSDAS